MLIASKSLAGSHYVSQTRPEILLSRCEQTSKLDVDPRLEGGEEQHTNILSVNSLQSLKNNLSNVIVVGLIVAAFKKTIGFEVNEPLICWRCVVPWPCWPSVLG